MMANRLADEQSLYLRQHADNPVDWRPWGDEAFGEAARSGRPVLLSIGYSACHWCHVMARESFSDPETARIMNENFVCVKVDREERPDVDTVYMTALQAMTGSGGWPLTAALTPAGDVFFAGTYFPPEDRHGLPSFRRLLGALGDAWRSQRDRAEATAADVTRYLREHLAPAAPGPLDPGLPARAVERLGQLLDPVHGGFGGAPKFPHHAALQFLLARPEAEARAMALTTLRSMVRGGIFDQVGGGFARYTVDEAWLVPHFEKMLFDNGLLLGLCAAAWSLGGESGFARAARATAAWMLREMRLEDGTFASALSAESDGHEGAYYLWSADEFGRAAADPAAAEAFGVTAAGNFEGANILTLSAVAWGADDALAATLDAARARLLAARARRNPPERDGKVITAWNGLAIEGLADAGRLLGEPAMVDAALGAWRGLAARRGAGELKRGWGASGPLGPAQLEDVAALGNGLLALHRATLAPELLDEARALASAVVRDFVQEGALYGTANGAETLIARPRGTTDAGTPADTAHAARLLLRIGRLTDDAEMQRLAAAALGEPGETAVQAPTFHGTALAAMDELLQPPLEIVLAGERDHPAFVSLAAAATRPFLPHATILYDADPETYPAARGRGGTAGRATAWVCRGRSCRLPLHDATALRHELALPSGGATT